MVGYLNGVAFFVFLGAAIWGYHIGDSEIWPRFQIQVAMTIWVPGFLIGSFFLGLARIVELLEKRQL